MLAKTKKTATVASLLGTLLLCAPNGRAETMRFPESVAASLNDQGGLAIDLNGGGTPIKGRLIGTLASGTETIAQTWGTVEDNAAKITGTKATGVLTTHAESPTPNEKIAEFSVNYEAAENTLAITIEITYLGERAWKFPLGYRLEFPASEFQGGSCEIEGKTKPVKVPIDNNTIPIPPHPHKFIQLSQVGETISMAALEGSKVTFSDARAWGGEDKTIPKRTLEPGGSFTTTAGQKELIRGTITFKGTSN